MKFLVFATALLFAKPFYASVDDEGMWLPLLLKDYNYEEMKRLGCTLTPEQIYSINNSSIKDAIVQLGGFCTAEVVSDKGLLFTNHHCAYDAIAELSSETDNYLRDGFWAQNHGAELPIPDLSVKFLVRMEDMTSRINKKLEGMDEDMKGLAMMEEMNAIKKELSEEGRYNVSVKEMFDGNAVYAFLYHEYTDIRLVGCPPKVVGKFGGDTDNWQWPRHTCDFSMLRIYAGENNAPADYSASNKPYAPNHFLPVSTAGVSEGDFTMVMGYPGSTDRYLTSHEVREQQTIANPVYVDILGKKLEIMKTEMDKSDKTFLDYASSYASSANTYKYFKGQLRGLKKFDLIGQKEMYEKELTSWINSDPDRKKKYGSVLSDIKSTLEKSVNTTQDQAYFNFGAFGPDFINRGITAYRLHGWMENEDETRTEYGIDALRESLEEFESYSVPMDRNIFKMALDILKNDVSQRADFFEHKLYTKNAKGDNDRFVDLVFHKSILTDKARMEKFLAKPTLKALDNDPGVLYILSIIRLYRELIVPAGGEREANMEELRQLYMEALQLKESDKKFYPDANFTMRMTYGKVKSYSNWEGKPYSAFTYGNEILDKYKAGDEEFDVPEKLRSLLKNKDFGRYANKDGNLTVCFVHDTDITGGNSGSPVINGKGELVGIAFDGNWESMTSDLTWDDNYVRTISVDIRYVLFMIDKFAGAGHLVEEMKLVK